MKLLFFAESARWAGRRELELRLERPRTLRSLLESRPELAAVLARAPAARVAVNQEFSSLEAEVHDGDEVAFIPPVSGG